MRMLTKGLIAALVLISLSAVAGCGTFEEPAPVIGDELRSFMVGKKWIVEDLFDRRMSTEVSLEFLSNGTVKAFGGCNELTGSYTLVDDALTFGDMTSTGKECGPALDEQEYSFTTFLARVEHARPDGSDLLLTSRDFPEPIRLTTAGGGLFW